MLKNTTYDFKILSFDLVLLYQNILIMFDFAPGKSQNNFIASGFY